MSAQSRAHAHHNTQRAHTSLVSPGVAVKLLQCSPPFLSHIVVSFCFLIWLINIPVLMNWLKNGSWTKNHHAWAPPKCLQRWKQRGRPVLSSTSITDEGSLSSEGSGTKNMTNKGLLDYIYHNALPQHDAWPVFASFNKYVCVLVERVNPSWTCSAVVPAAPRWAHTWAVAVAQAASGRQTERLSDKETEHVSAAPLEPDI